MRRPYAEPAGSGAPMFLTHEQVRVLTGARTRKGQLDNLRMNGIRHTINAAGWPVVTVAAVEGRKESKVDTRPWRSAALDE